MAQIQRGFTFVDAGGPYSAANLNTLADGAVLLPGAITDQTAGTIVNADNILFYSASATGLRKTSLSGLVSAFPTDQVAGTASLRTLGTAATQAAPGNDTRFSATLASSVGKVRLIGTSGLPANDTGAAAKDFAFPSVNIHGLTNINLDSGDLFYDTSLTANTTYTFSNSRDGRVVALHIFQNGKTVSFPGGFLIFGTANTAGWNIYTLSISAGATLGTVVN